MTYRFSIHGARGTRPAIGKHYLRYGGDTTCFSLESDEGLLVIDAGTGLVRLGQELQKRDELPPISIFFSHFHSDHVMGLSHFAPLYNERTDLSLVARGSNGTDWRKALNAYAGVPFWPVSLHDAPARTSFAELPEETGATEVYGIRVSWCPLNHPQGCRAFKLRAGRMTIVLATDHEPGDPVHDQRLLEFCRGADLLVHDAQYTREEYGPRKGWGHATVQDAIRTARDAGVEELFLTHHDPDRRDDHLDGLVEDSRKAFRHTFAAKPSLTLTA